MGHGAGTGRPQGVRSLRLGWKTQPTMRFTLHVLQSVAVLDVTALLWLVVGVLHGFAVRSAAATAAGAAQFAGLLALNARDVAALRAGDLRRIRPSVAFAEVSLGVGAYTALGVGLGPVHGTALFFTCLPAIAATFFGDNRLLGAVVAVVVAGIACEAGLLYPATQAVVLTVAYAGGTSLVLLSMQSIMNAAVRDMDRMSAVNTLAATAGTLRHWPGDLVPVARDLAAAMDVDRYLVFERVPEEGTARLAFAWPHGEWVDASVAGARAEDALRTGRPVVRADLVVTPVQHPGAPASAPPRIAVVTPLRSTARVPVDPRQTGTVAALLAAMCSRADLVDGLTALANTDELTGLANRRRFFEVLEREMARAARGGTPLSVAMLDLDHFKAYNDRLGHAAGDDLLRRFARAVSGAIRAQDLLARYGGEEFVLVLPDTDAAGAEHLLRAVQRSRPGAPGPGDEDAVTFSAGVARWDGAEPADGLVLRADRCLYAAKTAGRDRVVSTA